MVDKWDMLAWEDYDNSDENEDNVVLECELVLLADHRKSIKVLCDSMEGWLPISQIKFLDKPVEGEIARVEMPKWIAEKKEFINAD